LAFAADYLGIQTHDRNAAAATGSELQVMTTFDKREEGFEKKFAIEEELKFKAEARRNKLLGLWAASLLGKSGEAAAAYASEIVDADFDQPGGGAVRKVTADLDAAGADIPEAELGAKIDELTARAILQVKAGE
jgi:hypothetical protein